MDWPKEYLFTLLLWAPLKINFSAESRWKKLRAVPKTVKVFGTDPLRALKFRYKLIFQLVSNEKMSLYNRP